MPSLLSLMLQQRTDPGDPEPEGRSAPDLSEAERRLLEGFAQLGGDTTRVFVGPDPADGFSEHRGLAGYYRGRHDDIHLRPDSSRFVTPGYVGHQPQGEGAEARVLAHELIHREQVREGDLRQHGPQKERLDRALAEMGASRSLRSQAERMMGDFEEQADVAALSLLDLLFEERTPALERAQRPHRSTHKARLDSLTHAMQPLVEEAVRTRSNAGPWPLDQ